MALVLATAFVAVAVTVLGMLVVRMVNTSRTADEYVAYETCMDGLDAAVAQSQNAIETGRSGYVGVSADLKLATASAFVSSGFGGTSITPMQMSGATGVAYYAYVRNWGNDGYDNNGDGVIDDSGEQGFYSIYAAAKNGNFVRRAEVVLKGADVSVWNNAIFAGDGVPPNTNLINGNVVIAGSVHLLGNQIPNGAVVVDAIDLSGTAIIRNNYSALSSTFTNLVPPIPTRTFGGESNISTLNAVLRVKHGLVGTSGNSEIGQPNVTGNSVKETMDGVYVTDGYDGNHAGTVYSDNGSSNPYDLGNKVPMPTLSDPWVDPTTGNTVTNPSTGGPYTFQDYFNNVIVGTTGVYTGSVTLGSSKFYWDATTHSSTKPATLPATDNYIYWDGSSSLYVHGDISINGSLTLSKDATLYGRAAILVNGNVDVGAGSIMPENSTGHNSFPITNCLGLMASGNLIVGSSSQKSYCGAFYAQGTITSSKQTTVMGTFVSNWFNMGNQVPSIYQVPLLPKYLPYGMIGMRPILVTVPVSWRELGI